MPLSIWYGGSWPAGYQVTMLVLCFLIWCWLFHLSTILKRFILLGVSSSTLRSSASSNASKLVPQGLKLSPLIYLLFNNSVYSITTVETYLNRMGFVVNFSSLTAAINLDNLQPSVQRIANSHIYGWGEKKRIFSKQINQNGLLLRSCFSIAQAIDFGNCTNLKPVNNTKCMGISSDRKMKFSSHQDCLKSWSLQLFIRTADIRLQHGSIFQRSQLDPTRFLRPQHTFYPCPVELGQYNMKQKTSKNETGCCETLATPTFTVFFVL